jgi:DNA sulfur modification protein DndB
MAFNEDYVLGTLTYAMDREGEFEPIGNSAIGLLKLPLDAKLRTIDGQHRRGAIKEAVEAFEQLEEEDTVLLVYVESDMQKRRQMFSDMNWHQKPVTKSVNVAFDSRDPFARAVQKLSETHELLRDRVEMDSSTIHPGSDKLFTLGAIYDSLSRLFVGVTGRVRSKEKYVEEDLIKEGAAFFSLLLKARSEFHRVLDYPSETGKLRTKTILLSSTTLKMLAGAVYIAKRRGYSMEELEEPIRQLDFKPNATIWRKTGFVSPGKTTPNARNQEVKATIEAVVNVIAPDRQQTLSPQLSVVEPGKDEASVPAAS